MFLCDMLAYVHRKSWKSPVFSRKRVKRDPLLTWLYSMQVGLKMYLKNGIRRSTSVLGTLQ